MHRLFIYAMPAIDEEPVLYARICTLIVCIVNNVAAGQIARQPYSWL